MRRFVPHAHDGLDVAGLEKATDAFRRGDYARAIQTCLALETSFSLRTLQLPEGPGWALIGDASTVFVMVDLPTAQLVIESPLVRLPRTQRVGAMRRALELCEDDRLSSRICLRDELLLLRYVGQLAAVAPALVRHVVREMLAMSERHAELFVATFDARSVPRADASLEQLGKKRKLGTLQVGASRTSIVPAPPSTLRPDFSAAARGDDLPPVLSMMFGSDSGRNSQADDMPPILAPPPPLRELSRNQVADDMPPILAPPTMMRDRGSVDSMPAVLAPPSLRDRASSDDMPAILAPSMAESNDSMDGIPAVLMPFDPPAPRGAPPPSSAFGAGSNDREMSPTTARLGAIPAVAMSPFQGNATRQRTAMGLSADGGIRMPTDPDTDVSGRKPAASPDKPVTPPDKLCELVHRAQTLATALSFAERQATMLLLVRATVYRAVYEFGESVPDAVSYLHRMTSSATRQIWSSKAPPDKNSPMPMAEPSLLAMERVVSLRGQLPKEPKLALDPLKTAAQAREHLARYVEEIELAPTDQPLRHFLAVGALCELLVRARLPSQTGQRIKDIIAHAQREIAKPDRTPEQMAKAFNSTLDLMMAALRRIISG